MTNPASNEPSRTPEDGSGAPRRSRALLNAWLVLCSLAALAICTHRAGTASLTHDEAFTFMHYMGLRAGDLLTLKPVNTNDHLRDSTYYCELLSKHTHNAAYTNNHLLNSLAMKGATALFGTSELACRLPNLLALALYLAYMALLIRSAPPLLAALAFPLLVTNGYLMEMFTLARGYGLSYGFLAMAMYHAFRSLRDGRVLHIVLFHLAGVLAALSNFALLTGYLAVLGACVIGQAAWARAERPVWSLLRPRIEAHALMLVAAFIILSTPIRHMREANELDFGGKATFYWDTVSTLIDSLVPGVSLRGAQMQTAWVILSVPVAIALILVVARLLRRDAGAFLRTHGELVIAVLTLVLIGLGAYAQHVLLGVDHLKGRFALFLLPPLMLTLILLMRWWAVRQPMPAALLMAAWGAWAVPRFAQGFGPEFSWEWNYDTQTKSAMQALADDHAREWGSDGFVQVGITWLFEPSVNYYRHRLGLDWMCAADRDGARADDDYRYVMNDDTTSRAGFTEIARFERSGSVLLRSDIRLRELSATADSIPTPDAHAHP